MQLYIILFLIGLMICCYVIYNKNTKGSIGERRTVNALSKLSAKKYKILNNITLASGDGTTQIDHVVISEFGLFIIETKNMQGRIIGNKNDVVWTQEILNKTYEFQNPLRQNYRHIKTIQTLLGLKLSNIFSVVVFVGESTFKTKMPNNVLTLDALVNHIRSKKTKIYSQKDVNDFYESIDNKRKFRNLLTDYQHIQYVKNNQLPTVKGKAVYCDQCGAEMKIREATKGKSAGQKFWGCSRFPVCKHTVNIQS